ncbi:MAG: divergent polysaccharide deacetylase family protein, partial [Dongiaceae bacterium]
ETTPAGAPAEDAGGSAADPSLAPATALATGAAPETPAAPQTATAAESETTAPGTTELAAAAPPAAPIDPPWRRYARPFPLADPRPRIAIVVTELGLSRAATEAAIDRLPPEVTLAFNPLAPNLQSWIVKARARGHEVMLDLPMEPLAYPSEDPGPNALLASLGEVENLRRLGFLLSRADGYVGVATYMGSRFEGSAELIEPVLRRLAEKGYLFLANRSGPTSEVPAIAAALQLPYVGNDRFLDTEATRVAIDGRLQQLERLARTRMGAVAMGLPYPVTIERVAAWAETLGAKGIALAPVSALVGAVEP